MADTHQKAKQGKLQKGMPPLNPKGRPKGSVSKWTAAKAKAEALKGITPLQFLCALVRKDPKELKEIDVDIDEVTLGVRATAATQAAPYMHRRMPAAADGASGGLIGSYTPEQLMLLSEDDLNKLEQVMTSIARLGPTPNNAPHAALSAPVDLSHVEDASIVQHIKKRLGT